MNKQHKFGILAAFIAALLFGAAAPLGKPFLSVLNNFQLAGLLYLGAALGVLFILLRQGSFVWPWQMSRINAFRLTGAVFFGGILGPVLLLAGLRIAQAASVSLWLNMEMLATVIIGYFFFEDHLTPKGWLASLGVFIAAVLLAWEGGAAGFKAGGLIALACLCWGIDNHLTALIDGITPAESTFWKGIVAGSINFGLGLLISPFSASAGQVLGALSLGAASYGISILLYITSAQNLGATRSQLIFSSAPFFGLLISVILGESLSIFQGIAFVLFVGSVLLLFRESHTHAHAHQPFTHMHMHYHPDDHHGHEHTELPEESFGHNHEHSHQSLEHRHPHWPDLHHRHEHNQSLSE